MNESPKRLYYRTAGTIEANESEGEEGMSDHRTIQEPTYYALKDYLHYQHPSTKGDVLLNEFCDSLKQIQSQLTASKARVKKLEQEKAALTQALKVEYNGPDDKMSGDLIDDLTAFIEHHKKKEQRIATLEQALRQAKEAITKSNGALSEHSDIHWENRDAWAMQRNEKALATISTALSEKEGR